MIRTIICADKSEPVSAAGKTIYTAPELEVLVQSCFYEYQDLNTTELLRELSDEPTLFWKLGFTQTEESVRTVKQRASAFAKLLLSEGTPCIVFSPPQILPFLLRALEKKGCIIRRSENGPIRPGERIRVTERKDHCGGCRHNCLLSNPGCGVGKDKARRGY